MLKGSWQVLFKTPAPAPAVVAASNDVAAGDDAAHAAAGMPLPDRADLPEARDSAPPATTLTPSSPGLSGVRGVPGKSVESGAEPAAETAAWKRVGLAKKQRRARLREEGEGLEGEGLDALEIMLQTPPAVARHAHQETAEVPPQSEAAQGCSPWQQLRRLSLADEGQRSPLADAVPIAAHARGAPCAPPSKTPEQGSEGPLATPAGASAGSEGGARVDGLLKTPPKVREMMDSIDCFLETRRRRLKSQTALSDPHRCSAYVYANMCVLCVCVFCVGARALPKP